MSSKDEKDLLQETCSNLMISDANSRFRVTEKCYHSTYGYLSEFLMRCGRRIDDVECFNMQRACR